MHKKENNWRAVKLFVAGKARTAESVLAIVRGPDPEFRDPIRFALLEAYPGPSAFPRLAKIIASLIPYELDDLEPSVFADIIAADPERGLESYIELIDRNWSLGELLNKARNECADLSPKLAQVHAAYTRWDEAIRTSVLQRFHDLIRLGS
ncbi:hypothetical protein [Hymenobacter cellulosilyticus]|uniref:Uncharacterized protein n=1 Tax=Hymenobacter cellulosilyticus TaxID=2932248 RepID=A0A8T9QCT9_9BACT|nr:hypothetical protein [Hymenobacter cellulosilyticus]UOQ75287.1 hypothetical protein MUN79_29285 [Hymenobacter cellulosilyticus]